MDGAGYRQDGMQKDVCHGLSHIPGGLQLRVVSDFVKFLVQSKASRKKLLFLPEMENTGKNRKKVFFIQKVFFFFFKSKPLCKICDVIKKVYFSTSSSYFYSGQRKMALAISICFSLSSYQSNWKYVSPSPPPPFCFIAS